MIKTPEYTEALNNLTSNMYDTSNMDISTENDVYKEPVTGPEDYGFSDSFMAGFRQYSPAPAVKRLIENIDFEDDPSYEPLNDDQIPEGYE